MHRLFCYPVAKQIEPDVSLDGSVQRDWCERAVQMIADRIAGSSKVMVGMGQARSMTPVGMTMGSIL